MNYTLSTYKNYTVLSLNGEIDLNQSPKARKQILECIKRGHNLLVDLSEVEYIDSSGVASLIEGFQNARAQMLEFALIGVNASTMQVLQLSRLDRVFTIYESLEDVKEAG